MRTTPRPKTPSNLPVRGKRVTRIPNAEEAYGARNVADMERRMAAKDHHRGRKLLTPEEFVARKRAGLYEREDSLRKLREGR